MEIVTRRNKACVAARLSRRYISRKQTAAPPLTNLMKYAVPAVLALLKLQYQTESNSAPLWCFAAATAVYWLTVGAMKKKKRKRYVHVLWRAALASGTLSALSVLAMLLPYPVSVLPLLIWLLLALVFATYAFVAWVRGLESENQNLPV